MYQYVEGVVDDVRFRKAKVLQHVEVGATIGTESDQLSVDDSALR
jgi:hypothetical protein